MRANNWSDQKTQGQQKLDSKRDRPKVGPVKSRSKVKPNKRQVKYFSITFFNPCPSPLQEALPNANPPLLNSPSPCWLNPPRQPLQVLCSAQAALPVFNHLLQLLPKILLQLCSSLSPAPPAPPADSEERHCEDQAGQGKARQQTDATGARR